MYLSVCNFHNFDGNLRGWKNDQPSIHCLSCREEGYFSEKQIQDYIFETYEYIAVYSRTQTGYPSRIKVVMSPTDSIFEAERMYPSGHEHI